MQNKTIALWVKKISYLVLVSLIISLSSVGSVLADGLGEKLKGRILLQVEQNGEAWYVNPTDNLRYFMGRPADAFALMKRAGIGISNSDIEKIEIGDEDDFDESLIDINFAKKQAGKILLQVEERGEAWYVNPDNNKRYFLNRPSDAFKVMRQLGLGISNNDIDEIDQSEITLTLDEAKSVASEFISIYTTSSIEIVSIEVEKDVGLFKLLIILSNNREPIESYLSLNGKKFFPAVVDIEDIRKKPIVVQDSTDGVNIVKSDKPEVELFVMSHCPFGTQMEKGIIPVIEALGDKIDFELKFNDYAMHGQKEIDEQLNQYCIQKNSPEKLIPYLKCFLENESYGEKCITENEIDVEELNLCVANTDTKYKISEMYSDKSTWRSGRFPIFAVNEEECVIHNVKGSPTLIINGVITSSARNSAALLTTICSTFNEKPVECEIELLTTNPSSGFGYSGSSSGSASCGG